jgi:hypothetical protein
MMKHVFTQTCSEFQSMWKKKLYQLLSEFQISSLIIGVLLTTSIMSDPEVAASFTQTFVLHPQHGLAEGCDPEPNPRMQETRAQHPLFALPVSGDHRDKKPKSRGKGEA